MKDPELANRRIFLVASAQQRRRDIFAKWITQHISNVTIYAASDGKEADFKLRNNPPHVLVTDLDLPKLTGLELVAEVLRDKTLPDISIIIASDLPEREHFVDQIVTQKVQFLIDEKDEDKFVRCLTIGLNRIETSDAAEYSLRFMAPGEVLFEEGEQADNVYIIKRGILRAQARRDGQVVVLGDAVQGEFVGEMAHINHESRSATVVALEDCELIVIPIGTIDNVLFSKPVWAQALVRTLSKRLKKTNQTVIQNQT
jgi:CRP/FNR family transcriptional regulator, cyclic AMP receptor protein